MKKALKTIVVAIILIVIGVVALFAFGLSQVDKIAKGAIEYGGTYAMGVETTVDEVDVNLFSGSAIMSGLEIDNPEGFDTERFFALGTSNASVDLQSIRSDTIVVPSVRLSGIDVLLDKGQDPSNYNQILKNLQRFESGESTPAEPTKQGKNVIIRSLVLEDINIRVANMPGVSLLAGDIAVSIPEITLENIGEQQSMKAGDVINLVIKTVLAAAVEAGGGIIPADVLSELGNGLSGLSSLSDLGINAISELDLDGAMGEVGEQINKAAENIQKQVDDSVDEIENTVDDAADKIKGIFGGKKDDG